MSTAKELYEAGKLQEAIEAVQSEVKSQPSAMRSRIFLFELLCFAGEYDRAERQLDVIGHQSAKTELAVQVYKNNLNAERDRLRLFSDGLEPHFLTEPPVYVDQLLSAITRRRTGDLDGARTMLEQVEEERPALTGTSRAGQFLDFRDNNDWVGPVLELIVHEKYTWLPFEQIRSLEIPRPKQLRDLMWAPARVEALDGTIGEVYIPALYVRSFEHEEDGVKLGRMTDWQELENGLLTASGLRLFLIDGEDKSLFEVSSIEFHPAVKTSAAPS